MLASFVQISVLHTLILGESLIVVGYGLSKVMTLPNLIYPNFNQI